MPAITRPQLRIRHVVFGEGRPKICLSVAVDTEDGVLQTLSAYERHKGWDVLELRLDYDRALENTDHLTKLLTHVRQATRRIVRATIRTTAEGGLAELDQLTYLSLVQRIVATGMVDIVDIELFMGDDIVTQAVNAAHANDVYVIMSSHDTQETPGDDEMLSRFVLMETFGADLFELAVTPHGKEDVIRLLQMTHRASGMMSGPIVTVALSPQGAFSDIAGQLYGSVMTYAQVGQSVFSDRMPLATMQTILEALDHD